MSMDGGSALKMNDKPNYTIAIDIGSTNTSFSISSHKKAYPTLVSLNDLSSCSKSRKNLLIRDASYFDETVFWSDYAALHRIRTNNQNFRHPIKHYLRNEGNLPKLPSGITVENLLTSYLVEINKCAKGVVEKKSTIKTINPSSITYCITLPASLYIESTMDLIRRAAVGAKLVEPKHQRERLILMKESIAAANFCKKEYEFVNKQTLKTGEHFLICDVGGKYVDVCVYEYTKLGDFLEVTKAQVGAFGTEFFEAKAKSLLKEKIGVHFDLILEDIEKMVTSIYIKTMCDKNYDGGSCTIELPESLKPSSSTIRGATNGQLTLTATELEETIYEPLFTGIFGLIHNQYEFSENKMDTMFITGGFGQSVFMQNRIKKRFGNSVSSFFIPRNGVFSISRGAIYSITQRTKELVVYKKEVDHTEKKLYKVVMGIDFGTTFSGVSYTVISDYRQNNRNEYLFDVADWPGKNLNVSLAKVPTVSAYKGDELKKWGYQISKIDRIEDFKKIQRFKLYLNNEKDLPELPENVNALKAISDYLQILHKHSFKSFTKKVSSIYTESDIRYCLTVPAMWTDEAKSTMRQAAIQAGIISATDPQDRLILVGEPEAAALYCEKMIEEYNLDNGDRFLICDAGGGTVDLVVYQVKIDNGKKSLIEVSVGTGDVCGATYIDEKMRYVIRRELESLTQSSIPITNKILDWCMTEFIDSIKHSVSLKKLEGEPRYGDDDDDDDDNFIGLPSQFAEFPSVTNKVSTIEDCKLHIPIAVIRDEVYLPTTQRIMNLIQSQFEQSQEKLDAIFLVGGFGQSKYLLESIRREYKSKIKLICSPFRGEMAIVRGAVLMGLNPQSVTERVIRRTYGFSCGLPFEEGDPDDHGYKSIANNAWYCRDRFMAYATKNEIKSINYFVERELVGSFGKPPILRLYAYDGDTDNIPRYTFDLRVKKVAQFKIEWPDIGITDPEEIIDYKVRFYLYQTEIKIQVDVRGHVKPYTAAYETDEQPIEEEYGIQGKVHGIQYDEINDGPIQNAFGTGIQQVKSSFNHTVAASQSGVGVELSQEDYGIQGVISEDDNKK